jgi:hypothetical protein
MVNMGYEKTALVHVRHIFRTKIANPQTPTPNYTAQQPELKHGMVCFICTTNLSHGLTPHLILDLAQYETQCVLFINTGSVFLVGACAEQTSRLCVKFCCLFQSYKILVIPDNQTIYNNQIAA